MEWQGQMQSQLHGQLQGHDHGQKQGQEQWREQGEGQGQGHGQGHGQQCWLLDSVVTPELFYRDRLGTNFDRRQGSGQSQG